MRNTERLVRNHVKKTDKENRGSALGKSEDNDIDKKEENIVPLRIYLVTKGNLLKGPNMWTYTSISTKLINKTTK